MALTGFKNRLKAAMVPLLILAGVIGIFVFLKATKPTQPPVEIQQKVWPIQAMTVQVQSLSRVQTLYGKVESFRLVEVSAPVTGIVAEFPVKAGDDFQKGMKLVALADSDLDLPYQIAKADVADTQAQLNLEKLAYDANQKRLEFEKKVLALKEKDVDRNAKLLKKDLASKSVLDKSKEALVRQQYVVVGAKLSVQEHKVKVSQLQARLKKSQANYEQAKINLERGRVIAPYDGRVAQVSVAQGNRVNAGTKLLSYYALDSLELRAKIPAEQLKSVYEGLQSGETLSAQLEMNNQQFELPLKRLAGEAETSGVDAFFALPDALKILRPGELLQVDFYGEHLKDVFAVPYSALYGADRIYVIEQGVLQVKHVKNLGETRINGQSMVLLRGEIAEGAQVMTTHLPNAISGLKVSVME
ncbi:efflux RND transporter periplasmic adaptor subunit [Hydrogenovibrio sp. 3SP14C1]|uniref:efflux RND transporter periplasmic adaptor subunit n=1 Tax=Hydrogenovibrio sp. 3SP14C1 TaxID=3038774 RepID=UPI002416930C|nr:efflux RND transporter periplasmic adaptor subunit [Hydrogenovibrio sp. 3SP14C1]MDG4812150.1 efflux RND transporter periplasmic adaptor subunit [Hydrogenovibrio sp. 3SP14C1]